MKDRLRYALARPGGRAASAPAALALAIVLSSAACVRFLPPLEIETPAAAVGRHVLCASLTVRDADVEPGPDKSVFVKGEDGAVCSLVAFKSLRGVHTLIWKWYDPERVLIRTSDPIAVGEDGRTFEVYFAWDKMTIHAGRDPGRWISSLFVDGILAASRTFEIR